MKSILILTALALSLAAGELAAQDQQAPPRKIRLMAVGDPPPFQQEYVDGIPRERDIPEGSIPPRQVEVATGAESGKAMRLALGETTAPLNVTGEATQVNLTVGGQIWHALKLPEGGDYLAILTRDPAARSWDKAKSILVPEGPGKFDEGDVRFISLTGVPVRFLIKGAAAFEVPPGKSVTRKLGVAAGVETLAQYRDPKEGWKTLWSGGLVQNAGERSTVLIYPADGVKPRQPLTVLPLRESTAPAPAPATPRPR